MAGRCKISLELLPLDIRILLAKKLCVLRPPVSVSKVLLYGFTPYP